MKTIFTANGKEYKLDLKKDYWGSEVISIRENNVFKTVVDVLTEPTQALLIVKSNILNGKCY